MRSSTKWKGLWTPRGQPADLDTRTRATVGALKSWAFTTVRSSVTTP